MTRKLLRLPLASGWRVCQAFRASMTRISVS